MRGFVTKTLCTTEIIVMAQPYDGTVAIEVPVILSGTRKIVPNRKLYSALEREAGLAGKAVVFGIVKTRYLKTVYKMPIDVFLASAEKIATVTSDENKEVK